MLACLGFLVLLTMSEVSAEETSKKEDTHAEEHHAEDDHQHGEHSEDSDAHHADDHHDDHGDDHAGDHGHAEETIWNDLSFWSIVAFAGFCAAIVKLGLWDSLVTNMTQREQNENQLITDAEAHLSSAAALLKEFQGKMEAMDETVAATMAEAQRDADHTKNDIVDYAQREASQMKHRAEVEIQRYRDQSLHTLFDHLATRVTQQTESKLRAELQVADQDRLIDETLNQLAAQ